MSEDTTALLRQLLDEVRGLRADLAGRGGGSAARPSTTATGGVVRFGRDKGKALADCADLTWYRNALAENVNDPSKARYRDDNIAHLAEVDAAMGGGQGHSAPAEDFGSFGGPPPDDDDVPFISCDGIR